MGMYLAPVWHENCMAVKMISPSVPLYLLKSEVYISHRGAVGDSDYHYQAPFFVTVNQDSAGIPRSIFLDSVSSSAQGEDSLSEGEWVDIPHHLLVNDSVFWIVYHWYADSPQSPLVGTDHIANTGNSYCGKRLFIHMEWYPFDYNLMIRAQAVINSKASSEANRFRVYRSTDSTAIIDSGNLIASVPTSRFQFTDSDVTGEETYYYQATSFSSSFNSPGSNIGEATPKRGAKLSADRKRFFVHLNSGELLDENLALTNTGGLPLWFNLRLKLENSGWMGGSDQCGYNWTDNSLQPDLPFNWVDIESLGTQIGTSGDDNIDYGFFPLGFPFPFYDLTFDSILISSDGWLSFSPVIPCYHDTFCCYMNKSLPYLWGPYNLVAPFWDDLIFTDSSAIYFYSNADSAVISFLNLYHSGHAGRGPYTFQTILFPDGKITFQYLKIDDSLYNATVGMQNEDGTAGLEVACNRNYLRDSLVVNIIPGWVKIDSMEGAIQTQENKTLDLKFDSHFYPKGVYQADLVIDYRDKNRQLEPLIIPFTLCIDTIIDSTTSVPWHDSEKPEKITLLQNFPNPFNPVTRIQYVVVERGKAAVGGQWTADIFTLPTTLIIYNLLGQRVKTLVDEPQKSGEYEVVWDGKDDEGKDVASGIYFCKLTTGSYQKTRKMVLLR